MKFLRIRQQNNRGKKVRIKFSRRLKFSKEQKKQIRAIINDGVMANKNWVMIGVDIIENVELPKMVSLTPIPKGIKLM